HKHLNSTGGRGRVRSATARKKRTAAAQPSRRAEAVRSSRDMKRLIATALVSAGLGVAARSNGGHRRGRPRGPSMRTGPPPGSTPPHQPTSSTALFHPAAGVLPYPTDLYFAGSTDGTLNIQPPNALMPNQAAINALDGFSTNAVIRERFGGALDPATFNPATVI